MRKLLIILLKFMMIICLCACLPDYSLINETMPIQEPIQTSTDSMVTLAPTDVEVSIPDVSEPINASSTVAFEIPTSTATEIPTPTFIAPTQNFRPMTGLISKPAQTPGSGQLYIQNGLSQDSVVILSTNGGSDYVVYLRANESFTLNEILDGKYQIFFTSGADWDGKHFIKNPTYQRFDELIEFISAGGSYSVWTITLQPVEGGTASTSTLDPKDFPEITK